MNSIPKKQKGTASAAPVQTLGLLAAFFALFAISAYATTVPGWWSSVLNTNPANDYMVANQGQLKFFTQKATAYINTTLAGSGGSGPALSNLVYGWQQDYTTHGYNGSNIKPADYQAVNVGQLKYIANLVYNQLGSAGYTGLRPSWLGSSNATDLSVANLGQLKEIFNFDLTAAANAATSLVATASSNPSEIDLSWTPPAVNNATSYTLSYSTDGGTTWTTLTTTGNPSDISFQAAGLDPTQQYQFSLTYNNSNATGGGGGSSTTVTTSQTTSPKPSPRYAVIDLGTNMVPVSVNNSGEVVGSLSAWQNGATTNLTLPPPQEDETGINYIGVTDVNDSGAILGQKEWFDGTGGVEDAAIYWPSVTSAGSYLQNPGTDGFLVGEVPNPRYLMGNSSISSASYGEKMTIYPNPTASAIIPRVVNTDTDKIFVYNNAPGSDPATGTVDNSEGQFTFLVSYLEAINRNNAYVWTSFQKITVTLGTVGDLTNYPIFSNAVYDHNLTINDSTIQLPFSWEVNSFTDMSPYIYVGIDNDGGHIYDDTQDIALGINAVPVSISSPTDPTKVQIVGRDGELWEKSIPPNSPPGTLPTWNSNNPWHLDDLVPTDSGWSNIGAVKINNSGAIVGTATYTPQHPNDSIPAGQHGVLLIPFEIDHEATLGSGNYDKLSTTPIFQPNDGAGRGLPAPTDSPGITFTATHNGAGVVTGLSATISTSIGLFSGTLIQSTSNPLVFADTGNTITVTLASGTTISDSTVDTIALTVTSASMALSGVSFTVVETNVATNQFFMPIFACTFTPDSVHGTASLQIVTPNSAGNGDYAQQSFVLNQTSTNVFNDLNSGMTVTVLSSSTSGGVGIKGVVLSGAGMPSIGIPLTLMETGAGTSIFYYGPTSSPGTNITPDDPSVTGDGTFYIRLKGMGSSSQQFTLTSDVDSITTTFTPDPNDSTSLRSDLLLLVPQGSNTSFGSALKVLQVPAATLASNWTPTIKLSKPSGGNSPILSLPAKPGLYVGIGLSPNDPKLLSDLAANSHYPNHLDLITKYGFAVGSFHLAADYDDHGAMTKQRMLAAIPTHSAWYSFQHGLASSSKSSFEGIGTYDLQDIKPLDIKNAIGNQQYDFVYLNGCKSADGSSGSIDMKNSWNCKAYLGNSDDVEILRAMKIGEEFALGPHMSGLTVNDSLQAFINQCNSHNPPSTHQSDDDAGILTSLSGSNSSMSILGF